MRRDGPVTNSTGKTTKGVVRNAKMKVPQNPMRRCVPQNPVSIATLPTPAEADYKRKAGHFGPHNIHENRPGTFVSSQLIFARPGASSCT